MGFKQAGFTSLGAIDVDPVALGVLEKNVGSPVFEADLSRELLPYSGWKGCDVIISGSPCQGFSTIGKRRLDDPRNSLLLVLAHFASIYKPSVVVAENVPGVASGKHAKYWKELHLLLRSVGYSTSELMCDASQLGVPQRRRRLVLVGWRESMNLEIKLPEQFGGVLKDALSGVGRLPNHAPEYLAEKSADGLIASRISCGQKLSNVRSGERSVHTWEIPEVFGRTTKLEREILREVMVLRRRIRVRDFGDADPVSSKLLYDLFGKQAISTLQKKGFLRAVGKCHDLVGTFNGKYRRLTLDQPSYTVDTRFGDPRCFLHPTEQRGFTVREAARIQGFPDDFIFEGTKVEQFRMIGNAVPPPMARGIAQMLTKALLD